MIRLFALTSLLFAFTSCDYKEYPQEEEWKENFKEEMQEQEERDINFTPGNT